MASQHGRFFSALAAGILSFIAVVLAGGFAAAALVRYSPGFDIDENVWNPKISAATAQAMHARLERENSLPVFYFRYLKAALQGNLGESESFKTPVSDLLKRRAPVSARLIGYGTAAGLFLGGILAWASVWPHRRLLEAAALSASGLLLAIPPAVIALAFFFHEAPLWWAVALILLPRVFGTMRALLTDLYASPSLLAARSRGLSSTVLALRYVLRPALLQLIALTGIALVLAFGAIIPIEALCDVPGIGQLAWRAALARDLPLLSGLALAITAMVAFVHSLGDFVR